MKKIILFLSLIMLTGCSLNTPKSAVENYLNKYKNLSSEVLADLEDIIDEQNLTSDEEDVYRSIMRRQYQDLEYTIESEEYSEDISYVTVSITVYDYYKAMSDASVYLQNNPDEFNDENGEYDATKFTDYKLKCMSEVINRVEFKIVFTVTKEDDGYVVSQPTESDLEKIHGIYNYEKVESVNKSV